MSLPAIQPGASQRATGLQMARPLQYKHCKQLSGALQAAKISSILVVLNACPESTSRPDGSRQALSSDQSSCSQSK